MLTRNGIVCFVIAAVLASLCSPVVQSQDVEVIAFGSCARERQEQPIWIEIIAKDPDLFLFIGDNHYADFWERDGEIRMHPVSNVERFDEAYKALAAKVGFQNIKKHCPIMATWDDHDYGANDAGNDYPLRVESQDKFVEFYGFAADHPIRKQKGIYHSQVFGQTGKRVQVIMLDTRYHRDALERRAGRLKGVGPYQATSDSSKTMLGAEQWEWLKEELQKEADVRVIASSIQVVADEHGYETWGNMPHERERLYRLIAQTEASGVVFVSGDRHLLEISRDKPKNAPYPIWDFTSSGLTQRAQKVDDPNRHRIGPLHRETNFGVVRIHWGDSIESTRIALEGFDGDGRLLTRQTLFLEDLQIE